MSEPLPPTIVIVQQSPTVLEQSSIGPQGPPGPPGPAGPSDTHFTHTQSSAASQWNVAHNLGYKPNVAVIVDGSVHLVRIEHINENNLNVIANAPISGTAECS